MCHARSVILFDLDGTLTDSAPGIIACIEYALDDFGIERPSAETMQTFLGPPLYDTFGGHFGMSEDDVHRAVAKYRQRYHDVGLFENNVYDGVPDMLAAVSAQVPLAVATSKPTYSATRILEHFDLAQYFDVIGGSELDGTRIHKEQVVAYSLGEMRDRGVASAPVMVGDREHDVRGAATHDVPCIGVMWGYGSREELESAGAVAVADTVADLQAMLLAR